ncbi:DUF342 domain-containing protein [Treponema primitia]|uniref:DUF342 domain-containing protein n=1 Tax=Treponema primitia TaxID=88058 RepID=UPI0002554D03|nr:FapA family protein [Treponema primitia]
MDNPSAAIGSPNDGKVNIRFSEDDIEAWADFIPPRGNGLPISNDYILKLLAKFNITYGLHWDTLKETALQCNLEQKPITNILIAMGNPPVKEVTEYFKKNPHLTEQKKPLPDKSRNDQIDYRTHSPFIIVNKDQVLAVKMPRIQGREGKNVHGVVMPFGMNYLEGVTGGANTRVTEKYILSEINGQLVEADKVLSVQKDLVIKGSVGYSTGNIIFPGDVLINGAVSDGFKIYSGGSVTIKQTFDVTEVITKGDLNVAGGIVGRGRAFLKVGGFLRTKFIQNCNAACRKIISVDTEISNSSVFTMETLDMGEKGKILGGEVYAIHGIKAGGIGKDAGRATHIHCGVDFTLQKDKEKHNNTLRILAEKLAKLREFMATPNPDTEKQAKVEEALHLLEEEQKKTTAEIGDLMGRINTDVNATVEVIGEIAPGTLIEICEIALFVAEPLKHVRIRLDKPGGKVISEPL